jgi:hypothetical protein
MTLLHTQNDVVAHTNDVVVAHTNDVIVQRARIALHLMKSNRALNVTL